MLRENCIFRRGNIYPAELSPKVGFVQSGTRPVIVLQNNYGNFYAPTLIVAPLSSNTNKKRDFPTHYYLESGVKRPSLVLLEQITTIDKQQVRKYIGKVDHHIMGEIEEHIKRSLGMYTHKKMQAP